MVEKIIENDLDDNLLAKGIIEKNWKVASCHEYLNEWAEIDAKNNYGFTDKLKSGEINIKDAINLVKTKYYLDNEYQDSFVIPEKATNYNIDCI